MRAQPVPAPSREERVTFGLIGNPNTGKTTIFNALCGLRARTANYPGTTTSVRTGHTTSPNHTVVTLVDLPGLYDLHTDSPESAVAQRFFSARDADGVDAIVVVVDATNLTRNLMLVGEVLAQRRPTVIALNMMDLARRRGITIDAAALARRLHTDVVPVVARTGEGMDRLREAIDHAPARGYSPPPDLPPAQATLEALHTWAVAVADDVSNARQREDSVDETTERLDRYLTHPFYGLVAFVAIMCGLFWTLFTLAAVPMDLIDALFGQLATLLGDALPAGPVREMLTQGVIGGLSGTIVFLPQICLLFFLISVLEDTGYLARAAFVMDGMLSRFGLPGQAFVPLLTSHACALPGIMSTKLIPNRRDRLATILVAPFMSCSARLPVYVLLTSLLFADRPALAGLAFAGCYLLGASAGLFTASLFSRTALKGRPRPMILELPPFRTPSVRNAVVAAKDQGMAFLRTAGTIIMAICIVMWWLSAYPKVGPVPAADALRTEAALPTTTAERAEALTLEADALQIKAEQAGSFAGRFGRIAQPLFAPLGFDWQLTVGIVTSFLAREVFVSTMSVLESGAGDSDVDAGVVERIRGMTRDDGTPVFTFATSAAALVFFVLAMQCLPTLAVTRRETGSARYALLQLGYMSGLAYVAAFVLRQGLLAAGMGS
jgi:ferrous iron transport protein B